ncbi:RodZ domain-containing protein [Nocardioides sp. AE5]|uniref:RodZ domain-containing protein n=1 Tax=Nocardioides sp. AE5 TaxID=2962573 RepID=UPI00288138F5|nr:helix-turn-helix domain-containing protein [Nocardioides sp. AE5]MDT0203347.1 helix-turn-helix domain-containing protein [Nocardioides sp. AE5]
MSAAGNPLHEDGSHQESTGSVLGAAPEPVEIHRNGGLAGIVGVASAAVAIAWLARATQTGNALDWVLFAVIGLVAALWLRAFVDARTPLLVADSLGVRLRMGRAWCGLPWGALAEVEHRPRRGLLRDGRLAMEPHNTDRILAQMDAAGRRQATLNQKMYGAPLALPLGLATKVAELDEDLTTSLRVLAGPSGTRVVEAAYADTDGPDETGGNGPVAEEPRADEEPAPEAPRGGKHTARLRAGMLGLRARVAGAIAHARPSPADEPVAPGPVAAPLTASATPSPLRTPAPVARIEVRSNLVLEGSAALKLDTADDETDDGLPEGRELRRDGSVSLVEETVVWGDRVRPIATAGEAVEPLVIDDFAAVPALEPVIGPEVAAARTRLGLSVDTLADRTRIRPHVIEAIEVDDFAACGGDFYARGHLRTLGRVLGLDVAPLLEEYDAKYADAPINPRRVFEAELATGLGGGIRSTKGGPNWSLLIAVVMTLVLAWSIARLAMDSPVEIQQPAPVLNGSDGPNQTAPLSQNVTVKVSATGRTHLEVRDGADQVVFDDDVDFGEVHRIDIAPPVRVIAADGGAIEVAVDGVDRGTLGADGKEASKTYRAE